MARVPTIAEEDAKRPNREPECLVGERTRIVSRIKSTLARLGIRNFKPTLRKASERLATVHTPEGMPLPPNTLAELQRDMARLGFVISQIREIEIAHFLALLDVGQSVPQGQQPLAAEPGRVQFLVRRDDNLALIHCRRPLAAESDSVIANDVDAHGCGLLFAPPA
jgi:transposase